MKKVFYLEFTYSNDDDSIGQYKYEYSKEYEKEKILKDTIHKLIYEVGANNIVVKEVCIYKVL